ncbi:MAG: sugar phosphate isomerase/epimerase [Desulfobacula sp.]|uniref:sugar phosphate isomerase/epimerase family protein n=1 Tax=Desulfobacula sp. TaxID=2593537 RepID=UPI0025C6A1F7|nr:sugar phosphate isomerase/epimerase family protein [Desulfobacula sp.]MCD4719632.1 sugar phosphate isomerase/epimerase [Desulfobacula sp.]
MLLGLHTYSLYLHGIGQAWAGFKLPWERQLSTFHLLDLGIELGLDGFHLDDGVLENLESSFLREVGASAKKHNLYLEYNMSLDLGNFGIGIQHNLKDGLTTAQAIGADVVKVSMDLPRPRPRAGSRFHPEVMPYLKETVKQLKSAAPMAEDHGIRLALENHCDSFSEEILWVLKEVNHPFVGACIDTMNAWHIAEDPMTAIENLAPVAFTNHFRDDRVEFCRDGFRVRGVAVGDGDIDMKKAYELIKSKSPTNRINIETEMGFSLENREEALRLELATIKKSIHYCRTVLNIN